MDRSLGGAAPLEYFAWRHGRSPEVFRGPAPVLSGRFVACIGETETFAPFVPAPYPALLGARLGLACANLGLRHAGPDALLADAAIGAALRRAEAVVVQLPPVLRVSNRFYAVHPRRNDRFLRARPPLRALFPEADLADVHYCGHLMERLARIDPERAALVEAEARRAWDGALSRLVGMARGPVWLLRFGGKRVSGPAQARALRALPRIEIDGREPGDREMPVFARGQSVAAHRLAGPGAHRRAAYALAAAMAPGLARAAV